ncbi:uncharacterized protein F5147DRAFT_747542 [Suillus discolor]|uniref:CxC2-like cysteine cluster KDZ transposase-associated domain-containing protein n=1 Tax=Suillus discolor TaxID=1912936 RepID=A0A9P7JQ32_9AGAM|nr:uncharacterized protein F5147DRAFT_747542 [Suillus discolor]KAG2096706.1 hypothetical protein F5147DRAFT_747542 [Suillus discolor]
MVNYRNRHHAELERYRQEFYAHNRAALRLVANNILEANRAKEQQRHASFEQNSIGHLSVSTAYYTVSDSSKRCWEEDTVVNYSTINEFDYSDIQPNTDDYFNEISEEPIRRKRTAGDDPLRVWHSDAELFLEEFICLEGRGSDTRDTCFCGSDESPLYRCRDCHGTELVCRQCVLHTHQWQLFHRIEYWNGSFFQRTSLKSLGLRIQLRHRSCLFPTTTVRPKTAATFRALEYFQILSFESKSSALEFYHTIVHLTDNTGIHIPKDHYESLLRMMREWRFLKQMKQFGQGHHPESMTATQPGACAVLCPACPHPRKNLPDEWVNAPPESKFLYALFVAINANFRLARRNVSSDTVDPGLNHGYTFFVEETAFKSFLNLHGHIIQEFTWKSTCSSHNAVNMADTKASRGLAATGAGTIDCAQHNFKQPNSVGDLQKGESMLSASTLQVINISYDIACQWSKKLWTRMSAFPQQYHLDHNSKTITFLVPKFHLPAHVLSCQTTYSFNFIKGVRRTDSEAPECGWADINPVATSTREMGPGSRRDTLDDHFNDWNWKKVCLMESLNLHRDLNEFEAALDPTQLASWKRNIEAWESDHSQPNPFELKVTILQAVTQASVRLALSKAESDEMECGTIMALHDDVSPSMLISSGLELEDQQRRLEFEGHKIGQHATDSQQATLLQRINSLRRCIDTWSRVQLLYMPCVSRLRSSDNIAMELKVHNINLLLPSAIPTSLPCEHRLLEFKWVLREAQANDALNDIHNVVNLKYHLYKHKDAFIQGQRANTRATGVINNADNQIDTLAAKYNAARDALIKLAPRLQKDNEWQLTLKPLDRTKDAVPLTQDDGTTVGQQRVSWIWKTPGVSNNAEYGLQDSHRWEEEVQLLNEERRRVLAFFEWQALWWEAQSSQRAFGSPEAAEGTAAYAHRQASLRRRLASHFKLMWEGI